MKIYNFGLLLFSLLYFSNIGQAQYFPGHDREWIRKSPKEMGLNADSVAAAIKHALINETSDPRNLEIHHYQSFGREPFGDGVGPHKTRGNQTGVILKDGYIIAEWGEPSRVDMTFSVTKSFLSATCGLAYDRGMIDDVNDPVWTYMAPVFVDDPTIGINRAERLGQPMVLEPFETPHNRTISWDHLLRQTSDWEGSLWGKPEWADRPSGDPSEWMTRKRHKAGTVYEYNDTRVNALALAATNIWRRPIQQVLKEYLMDPIGASASWRWMGYENSWIIIDGQRIQVPSGGGHWGGGIFINAFDQARFGYLTLHRGKWNGKQILSDEWVTKSLTPTAVKDDYGYMNWFLNTGKKALPSAPESAFYHLGAGTNMVYVDPVNNVVIVARWINRSAMDGIVKKLLSALPVETKK